MDTKKEEVDILNIQIIATIIYILSLFISYILTYNDRYKTITNKSLLGKKKTKNLSIFNRVVVFIITIIFLYINFKNLEIAKKKKQNIKPFKLQLFASELTLISSLIVLYTVISSGEYSITIGSENPGL